MRLPRRDQDPKVARLAALPLFEGCSRRELAEIARLVDEVDVPSGKVLMSQGRPGWECFVVASGHATVSIGGETVGSVGTSAVIGEVALVGDHLRSATVTAESDMHLFVMDARGFRALTDHERIADRIRAGIEHRAAADAQRG